MHETRSAGPNPKISFLIVNYNSRDVLTRCLGDLADIFDATTHEILIGNNDGTSLHVDQSSVRVIENGENLGFGHAHNILAREACGDILCFLNPDTYNFPQNFLDLVGKLSTDICIAAPLLVNPDGSPQAWSVGETLTPRTLLLNNFGLGKKIWEEKESQNVDWVSGGAFFITKEHFENLGGFDENYFLYFEDLDLCRRISEHDKKIYWDPTVKIMHSGGASSLGHDTQKEYYYTSQNHYFAKFHGKKTARLLSFLRKLSH